VRFGWGGIQAAGCASAGSPDTTLAKPHPNSTHSNQERNGQCDSSTT